MTNLRKLARGQPCFVRLPGCSGGGDDTVLAHFRMLPFNGTGIKPPDWMGAWCCVSCHDLCDSRKFLVGYERSTIRLAHAEGCLRTIGKLIEMGKL